MNTEKVIGKFVANGTDYVVVKMENEKDYKNIGKQKRPSF